MSVVRREAPMGGLGLGDDKAWPERLLPAGAALRSGPIAALDCRHPQWAFVQLRAPQRLLRRDREMQTVGVNGVRRSRRLRRTPRGKIGRRPDRLVQAGAKPLIDLLRDLLVSGATARIPTFRAQASESRQARCSEA